MKRRIVSTIFCILLVSANLSAETFNISSIINTAQEIPAPTGVTSSAGGFAMFQYDDVSKLLSWDIAWQDLTGPATGMHIHAPAASGSTAGVVVNLGDISGLASPSIGSATITDEVAGFILGGQSYVNIHTAQNGPGEIRGQLNPNNVNLVASLDTAQEIPAPVGVPADAGGSAAIAYDPATKTLGWNIAWQNLTGPAIGMHFHAPAGVGETAGVQVNVGDISGLTSPSIGSTVISDEFASQLLDGQSYLNIHTDANRPGEIRGQVVPEPSGRAILLAAIVFVSAAIRKSRSSFQ